MDENRIKISTLNLNCNRNNNNNINSIQVSENNNNDFASNIALNKTKSSENISQNLTKTNNSNQRIVTGSAVHGIKPAMKTEKRKRKCPTLGCDGTGNFRYENSKTHYS